MMETELLTIPTGNSELESELKNKKKVYMDHILFQFKKIEEQEKLPPKISLFKFKKTNLEVVVLNKSYSKTLENLSEFYIQLEEYENCTLIKSLINKIENMST